MRILFFTFLCCLTPFFPSSAQSQPFSFSLGIDRIFVSVQSSISPTIDVSVTTELSKMNANGSFSDINYAETASTGWEPGIHISRLTLFATAYSRSQSTYYGNPDLKSKIVAGCNYWLTRNPVPYSTNWWYYGVGLPKSIGDMLVCLRKSPSGISQPLETSMIAWMTKGRKLSSQPANDGANLTDIAQHYFVRGCLTANDTLIREAVEAFDAVMVDPGIQADQSFMAHGNQLYLSGYASEFLKGITNFGLFIAGTQYAYSTDQIAKISEFTRKGYMKPYRGGYADFNILGRGVSRVSSIVGLGAGKLIEMVRNMDNPSYAPIYNDVIERLSMHKPASFGVDPEHIQYWNTDYAIHQRPNYMVGLRSVSTRTVRAETINGENVKGLFMTEGVSSISVKGDEYFNIFGSWDWTKIPGTTVPERTILTPPSNYLTNRGQTAFVGGASDGRYGVSVFDMNSYNTKAKKGWFFFDDEIVCLGTAISSTDDSPVNTTVNQCRLKTGVTISTSNGIVSLANGESFYNGSLKWVWQDSVGYYFPFSASVSLSNKQQTGDWKQINTGMDSKPDTVDVFKLWLNHGTKPTGGSYAYIILPAKGLNQISAYNGNNITVISNTPNAQIVKNADLNMIQAIFYQSGSFSDPSVGLKIEVDKPCALVIKKVNSTSVQIAAADPAQSQVDIGLRVTFNDLSKTVVKNIMLPQSKFKGSSVVFTVNSDDASAAPFIAASFLAVADAHVRNGQYQAENYGALSGLTVKSDVSGYEREAFVKFDLHGLSKSALLPTLRLRLYLKGANTDTGLVNWQVYHVPNNNWTETGITWTNKPNSGTLLASVKGSVGLGYVEWPIGAAMATIPVDSILSLRIVSDMAGEKTDVTFGSREEADIRLQPSLLFSYKANLAAIADAYVRNGSYQGQNFGLENAFVVKNDGTGYAREAYLKFDFEPIPSNALISSIELNAFRTYVNTAANSTNWQVQLVPDNGWLQTSLTWSNKPSATTRLGIQNGTLGTGQTKWKLDTALTKIGADDLLSVKITGTTTGGATDATFASRENTDPSRHPYLSVNYELIPASNQVIGARVRSTTKNLHLESLSVTSPEIGMTLNLAIFPNPIQSDCIISANRKFQKIILYNSFGNIVGHVENHDSNNYHLSLKTYPPGLYLVKVIGDGLVNTYKLVKK